MLHLSKRSVSVRSSQRALPFALGACAVLTLTGGALRATPVPANLGNGLDRLITNQVTMQKMSATRAAGRTFAAQDGRQYTDLASAKLADLALMDDTGRVLVRIYGDGSRAITATRRDIKGVIGSFTPTAVDKVYNGIGVMNAYVALEDVATLAQMPGVKSVVLELKPRHNKISKELAAATAAAQASPEAVVGQILNKLGNAFDQGVTQHRVDQINKYYNPSATLDFEGQGMSIGLISDSYNTAYAATNTNAAAAGVTRFDLPGAANNPVNTTPVAVLQDFPGGTDEGRGMTEIAYKMAPKAALAFASADYGEVGFANNIRALAGIPGFTYSGQTFVADTISDDVGYFDEPYFQDGIIGNGVDDATAAGVAYFSSAANDAGNNGYDSDLRWVDNGTGFTAAAGNTALAGTNIDLSTVPAGLYAGGFHNFNPNGGLDVAQTVNIASNANQPPTILQWNEPYDQNTTPVLNQPPIFTGSGTITGATTVPFTGIALTAGTLYQVNASAASGSSVDVTVTVTAPDGTTVVTQDNAVDEVVRFYAPQTGNYTITIGRFSTTTGAFTVTVYSSPGFVGNTIKTDVNLLAFNVTTGAYVPTSSLVSNNFATNQPIELGYTLRATGSTQLQYVIARSNKPVSGGATHVRYLIPGNGLGGIGPAEYFNYTTVTTGGHAMASGCNGTAAYDVFRPSLPEQYSSPGPVTIYFDKSGNPLATPEVRLQPRVAAADNGNTSFFGGDTTGDQDSNANFSGTSAAGPHAAAIGALVLQAAGGPRSLTPLQVRNFLQSTAFQHDLDPEYSSGSAKVSNGGRVTIAISSDNSTSAGIGSNDNNAISVSYTGTSSITSLVFNPGGTSATAGGTSNGNNGVTYTGNGSTFTTVTYFENSYPGMVWAPANKAFTIGSASTVPLTALTGGIPLYTNLAGAPSTVQSYTMTLNFNSGAFSGGNILKFNVGRSIQHSSVTGNTATIGAGSTAVNYNADLLGATISLPSGVVPPNSGGMTFSGTTANGGTFSGVIGNRIGNGYSVQDGYGFINAEAAVKAAIPAPTRGAAKKAQ